VVNLQIWQYLIISLGTFLAGGVNALAGGGTLITFPLLTAMGLPAITANITNTIGLCPGSFGATLVQLNELKSQKYRLILFIPAALVGGIIGGVILLHTGERSFQKLIPYLILLASVMLALGTSLRKWVSRKNVIRDSTRFFEILAIPIIILAAIYGGYFGAGLSVILLAVLGMLVNDSLKKLIALRQVLAFATNVAAAIFFVFSGNIQWIVAVVMAISALVGGVAGGKLVVKLNPEVIRWVIVSIGLIIGVIYLIK
jgi:uncharacterized membrane protein YfcA